MSRAYYNENDPKAAAWLRELIRAGLIADGDVDERSITEISPHELTGYTQQHFFAGIGGWSYALRLAGWPDSKPVRTGSCPCQPFSAAGKQLGESDVRHLWPVFRDLITFGEATVTFGEQVASALGRQWLAGVRADLEGLGYAVGAADLCAASAGAPHIRQRLYWVANPEGEGRKGVESKRSRGQRVGSRTGRDHTISGLADMHGERCAEQTECDGEQIGPKQQSPRGSDAMRCGGALRMGDADSSASQRFRPVGVQVESKQEARRSSYADAWARCETVGCADGKARRFEPGSFPLANGVSGRVGLLRGYGNAIVPQAAAEFIQACRESGVT